MTPLPPDVVGLFSPPFAVDPSGHYVRDANSRTAASLYDGRMGPRGWGFHQYMDRGAERHDAWCRWYAATVPVTAKAHDVRTILNAAWRKAPRVPEQDQEQAA